MNVILFDDSSVEHLYPLTLTRPAAALRVGIMTIGEKWAVRLNSPVSHLCADHLSLKYPADHGSDNIYINGRVLPSDELVSALKALSVGERITNNGVTVAQRSSDKMSASDLESEAVGTEVACEWVNRPFDLFAKNEKQIREDFSLLTKGKKSAALSASNRVTGTGEIFIEEGATVEGATLNPKGGCVYVGKSAEIMEGSLVRGSLAMCEGSVLKLGAKIYGATTLGPFSKVGGEVNNSVLIGYSNKGHDGFLGNSVIGEWCNIGADSNNSNLKNNYTEVRIWDYAEGRFTKTGLQFCGLIMGDHSKCGINTMFNTGTVTGVSCNIFGSGFPRNYIPSFAWGGSNGFSTYQLNKALETAEIVMARRNVELGNADRDMLSHVFANTEKNRFWETKKD